MDRKCKNLDNPFLVEKSENHEKADKLCHFHNTDLNIKKAVEPTLMQILTVKTEAQLKL